MQRLHKLSQNFATRQRKFIILFGAPGVGKGTYSKMLAKDLSFNHISTGDQIRKILSGKASKSYDNKFINEIKSIVKAGGLVKDQIVIDIIHKKIQQPQSKRGIILDGFPRTEKQLRMYMDKFPLDVVLNLQLRKDVLFDKLMGRRTCEGCGAGFNVCDIQRDDYSMEPMLPKIEGKCDHCGKKLIIREDDTAVIIEARMKQYSGKTAPLLKEFEKTGKLVSFECKRGVKDYYKLKEKITSTIELNQSQK